MATQTYSRSRPPSDTMVRARALLRRYPNLSDEELVALIKVFPDFGILDLALVTTDDQISVQLEAFYRDHGEKIGTPALSLLAVLALPCITLGALWWMLGPSVGL